MSAIICVLIRYKNQTKRKFTVPLIKRMFIANTECNLQALTRAMVENRETQKAPLQLQTHHCTKHQNNIYWKCLEKR